MKVSQIVNKLEKQRPDINYSTEEYLTLFYELYEEIYDNIFKTHENCPDKILSLSLEDDIGVPDSYSEIFYYYLLAKIDFDNSDITRYANDMLSFNKLYEEFVNYYNRNNMPIAKGSIGGY